MTPQERDLIIDLFDRLASLERNPRDAQAESVIREGLRDAPNAMYALVQTVLVQDEALKAANARIQQYEGDRGGPPQQQDRGFLDNMRDTIFGRDESRGSVPRVPQAGAPQGRPDPWGRDRDGPAQQPYQQQPQQQPYQQQPYAEPPRQGGSFLGTAAAAAAGVIGGSLLMNGIRSAFAGHQAGPFSGTFNHLSGSNPGDLSREAGYQDIGSRVDPARQDAQDDAAQDAQDDQDQSQDDDQDSGDTDTDN